MVRLLLNHLNRPHEAFQLVRDTRLQQGAELIAEYCRKRGDIQGAIEFLLICNNRTEAFELASTHDEMEVFEQSLEWGNKNAGSMSGGESSGKDQQAANTNVNLEEEYRKIANYYETRHLSSKAAMNYTNAGDYQSALNLYLKVGAESDIEEAINVVGKARNDKLTHQLIDHLMGESYTAKGGVPDSAGNPSPTGVKDPSAYICKLHKALGNYEQAADTALILAKKEQDQGNYKVFTIFQTVSHIESMCFLAVVRQKSTISKTKNPKRRSPTRCFSQHGKTWLLEVYQFH